MGLLPTVKTALRQIKIIKTNKKIIIKIKKDRIPKLKITFAFNFQNRRDINAIEVSSIATGLWI